MASKQLFEDLINEITEQVLQQVQEQMNASVASAVKQRLTFLSEDNLEKMVTNEYIDTEIKGKINQLVDQYTPDLTKVEHSIQDLTTQWAEQVQRDINTRVAVVIDDRINQVDLESLVLSRVEKNLDPATKTYPFKESSIPSKALNLDEFKITGDMIEGGVIKTFGSTGIDDQATECKVTILDQGTVFENTLIAPRIEIKGGALIDGNVEILGTFVDSNAYRQLIQDAAEAAQTTLTDDVIQQNQNLIFQRIRAEGIDLSKVTINGESLVEGDRLLTVVNSQLRTVGTLQDLQTSGDTFLSDSLFVANKRVGINTMDPKNALSVWDEEVEFSLSKQQKGVGRIAVERGVDLVLGSNDNDNITLKSDGSTAIPKLHLGGVMLTSSLNPPTYAAAKGTIVFNENPSLGGPLGWVSLGENRWANFGIID